MIGMPYPLSFPILQFPLVQISKSLCSERERDNKVPLRSPKSGSTSDVCVL